MSVIATCIHCSSVLTIVPLGPATGGLLRRAFAATCGTCQSGYTIEIQQRVASPLTAARLSEVKNRNH
jgi:hypothetical protein